MNIEYIHGGYLHRDVSSVDIGFAVFAWMPFWHPPHLTQRIWKHRSGLCGEILSCTVKNTTKSWCKEGWQAKMPEEKGSSQASNTEYPRTGSSNMEIRLSEFHGFCGPNDDHVCIKFRSIFWPMTTDDRGVYGIRYQAQVLHVRGKRPGEDWANNSLGWSGYERSRTSD